MTMFMQYIVRKEDVCIYGNDAAKDTMNALFKSPVYIQSILKYTLCLVNIVIIHPIYPATLFIRMSGLPVWGKLRWPMLLWTRAMQQNNGIVSVPSLSTWMEGTSL